MNHTRKDVKFAGQTKWCKLGKLANTFLATGREVRERLREKKREILGNSS